MTHMADGMGARRISPEWWAMLLVVGIVAAVVLSLTMFNRTFTPSVPVTLTADRSGLVLEPNSRVKMRGVQVGRVSSVGGGDSTRIQLDIDPAQIQYIPANVEARIQSISLFGAKYVDLVYPPNPSPQRPTAGAVLRSLNVATEVNTVFQNAVQLIKAIDPFKLNAVLSALAEGVRTGRQDRRSDHREQSGSAAAESAHRHSAGGLPRA